MRNILSFYSIRYFYILKVYLSQRCLAGFDERTATQGLKKCLSNLLQ